MTDQEWVDARAKVLSDPDRPLNEGFLMAQKEWKWSARRAIWGHSYCYWTYKSYLHEFDILPFVRLQVRRRHNWEAEYLKMEAPADITLRVSFGCFGAEGGFSVTTGIRKFHYGA
mgnify:CR=1 FL=1